MLGLKPEISILQLLLSSSSGSSVFMMVARVEPSAGWPTTSLNSYLYKRWLSCTFISPGFG